MVFKRRNGNGGETLNKKSTTSLVLKEIKIKTTLKFHFTPVRMTNIKKTNASTWWRGCGERGLGGNANWSGRYVNHVEILQKADPPQHAVTPVLGTSPKDSTSYCRYTCSSTFIAALFLIVTN